MNVGDGAIRAVDQTQRQIVDVVQNNNIGKGLKMLRKRSGMTLRQLAEKSMVNFGSISRYENDISKPDFWKLYYIANAFGMSIEELVKFCTENGEKRA